MMIKTGLLILVLAVFLPSVSTHSQNFTFAFTWLGGYCKGRLPTQIKCSRAKYNLWDHQSFTIHGLWAQNRSTPRIFGGFDKDIIAEDKTLANKLMEFMPPQSKRDGKTLFLWQHEWQGEEDEDAHGHDFGHVHMKIFPGEYKKITQKERNYKVQKAFFNNIVNFYESYPGIQKIRKPNINKEELAKLFKLSSDGLDISCTSENYIKEIKICAALTRVGYEPIECSSKSGNCNDWNSYVLHDWQYIDQKKVVAFDSEVNAYLYGQPLPAKEMSLKNKDHHEQDFDQIHTESEQDEVLAHQSQL